jgi:hypothetical protein
MYALLRDQKVSMYPDSRTLAMKVVNPLRSVTTHWPNALTMRMDGT